MLAVVTFFLLAVVGSAHARNVVATIPVFNGGQWGEWAWQEFCPTGTYVNGLRIKIHRSCGLLCDNTALNGVDLECVRPGSDTYEGTVKSQMGPWGELTDFQYCEEGFYVYSFLLRVAAPSLLADETAANNIRVRCRDMEGTLGSQFEGDGEYGGEWGVPSPPCPAGTAVCGMQSRVEEPKGILGDNTALNDVTMFCCDD